MGSTFWAVSYFRSLKRTKVLALLTKYLVQYKRVSIPHIGTFEIVQQSPELHIADHLITAPVFTTKYVNNDRVPEHQFLFIASCESAEKARLEEELVVFGENLKRSIQSSPFRWNGIGTLRYTASELVFDAQSFEFDSLKFVPARKVMRENPKHSMLVGDQQMNSEQITTALKKQPFAVLRKPGFMFAGWTILILALIAIFIHLFLGKFDISAAGLR
jgi:hypothetical protein